MNYPNFDFEEKFWNEKKLVAGLDEAGRGCIAGPVFAAAVIFPINFESAIPINDSKKLSHKKRTEFLDYIAWSSVDHKFSSISNEIIDEINILHAPMKAMHDSVNSLSQKPSHLLIDGNYFKENGIEHTKITGGDSKSVTIAAASIVAKVKRDLWMIEVADKEFPEYGFKDHKGYGTKKHYEAIEKYGICKYHRLSFLKKYGY